MNSESCRKTSTVEARPYPGFVDLQVRHIEPRVREQLPPFIVRTNRVVPLELEGSVLVVAMENPGDLVLRHKIRYIADRALRVVPATGPGIDQAIEKYFAPEDDEECAI